MESEEARNVMAEGLETVKTAAAFLKISVASIYKLMDAGRLDYTKIGKCRRIPRRALIELAASGLVTRRD